MRRLRQCLPTLLLARVLLLLLHDASADLPVHCLHGQILGRWVFHVGAAQDLLGPGLQGTCGHHVPGTKEDVMVEPSGALRATEAYEITLTDPDVVTDSSGRRGFWTMVYDEGYEVQIGGRSFFAFSRFHPSRAPRDNAPLAAKDTAGFASDCSMTAVGWFLDNGTRWGCYYGQQVSGAEGTPLGARRPVQVEAVPEEPMAIPRELSSISADPWTDQLQGSFLQQQQQQQQQRAQHRHLVRALNARPGAHANSSWRARLHPAFAAMSFVELAEVAGGRAKTAAGVGAGEGEGLGEGEGVGVGVGGALGVPPTPRGGVARARADNRPDALKYAGLPSHWDWRNVEGVSYMGPVRTQGSCGSCYAMATVAMLEARARIASANLEQPLLSVQDVVSCSPYSQGCDGGFPYLVGKYLHDYGVVSEECFPYEATEGARQGRSPCSRRCAAPRRRWHAANYRYVGGRYGSCNEAEMMREVYTHGPIVIGFEARAALRRPLPPTLATH